MAKKFSDLVKSDKSESKNSTPKVDKEIEVVIQAEPEQDDLGCLLCSIMEALGQPKSMFKDFKADRIPSILGGDSAMIIQMGGPEIAYHEDNMMDIFKDIVKMIDSKKEYSKEDIAEIRKNKKQHGSSLKKLLALMDDDHISKAFHGMQIFKNGGDIFYAERGGKTARDAISGEIIHLPDGKLKDGLIKTLEGEYVKQGNKYYKRTDLKKSQGGLKPDTQIEIKQEGGDVEENNSELGEKITVNIGNKEYHLWEAKSQEEKEKGLQGITELADDEGMIFYYDEPQELNFWMKDTEIPLTIIFFNEDYEAISIQQGHPLSEDLIGCENAQFVVELNDRADVQLGDELDLPGDDDEYVMQVLGSDGSVQMGLYSGERIISRKQTRILIKKVKRAIKNKEDRYYKSVGKYMFKVLDGQDNRDPEYVQLDKDK